MIKLGVIGYGNRIKTILAEVEKQDPTAKVTAITDVRNDAIAKELGDKAATIHFYTDAKQMLEKEKLDGVLIGTRCLDHARFACIVARYKIPLFLEKPVAITYEDARKLKATFPTGREPVVISFPLRVSPLLQAVKKVVDSGRLGRIQQVLALNYVPFDSYAHGYYQYWCREYSQMGGLFLQKATHDLDYVTYLLGKRPLRLAATFSHKIFQGDKPWDLHCSECKDQEACPESPMYRTTTWPAKYETVNPGMLCAFSKGMPNEDCGSVLVEYEDDVSASYLQNFYTRRATVARGATLIGYKGTLKFDWPEEKYHITMHHTSEQETVECKSAHGHHGGDEELVRSFLDVIRTGAASISPIHAGILSAWMCLKARESAETHQFLDLTDL